MRVEFKPILVILDRFLSGTRFPLTGAKIPKIGKRGFRGQKPPSPTTPEKGALSQKIPIFLVVLCVEMGIF